MNTVLITGSSSGYGLETARYFHSQGWSVIATMRTPRPDVLPESERLRILPLDVTNTFAVMAITQAVLPQFRERRSGVLVNVTSSVVLARMPLVAIYAASKTAIEGFTASLALELEEFNVRVKLVEPGYGPSTNFTSNGRSRMNGQIPQDYAPFAQRVLAEFQNQTTVTHESDVAEAVWRAANDTTGQLRFPAGPDAIALAQFK